MISRQATNKNNCAESGVEKQEDPPAPQLRLALALIVPAITAVCGTEFIVVALIPAVAGEFGLTLATAGLLTAVFAVAAAIGGPLVTLACTRLSHRSILITGLIAFGLGNAIVVMTNQFSVILIVRAIQGMMLPVFLGAAAAAVIRLAPEASRGRALARANLGFVLAVVLAVPFGGALAGGDDWRLPLIVLAVAPLPIAALIAWRFPSPVILDGEISVKSQLRLLTKPIFLGHLALSTTAFALMFSAYTYLGAWFESVHSFELVRVAFALFVFGAVGLIGNAAAERVADRNPMVATGVVMVLGAVAVSGAALADNRLILAVLPLAVWGMMHTAGVTLSNVRVTLVGREAPAFSMTMNVSAANLGISVGALAGGSAMDSWGMGAIGVTPAVFGVVGVALTLLLATKPPFSKKATMGVGCTTSDIQVCVPDVGQAEGTSLRLGPNPKSSATSVVRVTHSRAEVGDDQ